MEARRSPSQLSCLCGSCRQIAQVWIDLGPKRVKRYPGPARQPPGTACAYRHVGREPRMRTALTLLLILHFLTGARFCCLLTFLLASPSQAVEVSQPQQKCRCCHRDADVTPEKPRQPSRSECPFQELHVQWMATTEDTKTPLALLLLEKQLEAGHALLTAPAPSTLDLAGVAHMRSGPPHDGTTERLRLYCISRC